MSAVEIAIFYLEKHNKVYMSMDGVAVPQLRALCEAVLVAATLAQDAEIQREPDEISGVRELAAHWIERFDL